MRLLSINLSLPKPVPHKGREVATGIFKEPVEGPIRVGRLNLEGDGQADLVAHGGACKAVYAYPFEHYDYWSRELGRTDFAFGQFGENFTVGGLLEEEVLIGDLLKIGDAVLEVTQPRMPCFKLGIRMGGLDDFPQTFLKSGLVGFYLRVVQEGPIVAGAAIERIKTDPNSMSVRGISELMHFDKGNTEDAKKALSLEALAPGWCRAFEERLSNAGIAFEPRDHPLESECCKGL